MTEAELYTVYRDMYVSAVVNTPEILQRFEQLTFRPDDVIICTYPKSGTTWMQEMVCLIMNEGDPESVETEPNWIKTPWMESEQNVRLKDTPSPRLLTTHFPYHLMPPSLYEVKPKVIYVMRNPRDVCTSHYYFHIMSPIMVTPSSERDFLQKFLDGNLLYGSWFVHIKSWLSAADKQRIMYVSYEEMTEDLGGVVRRVANFLDKPLGEKVISQIADKCGFNNMKKNDMFNYSQVSSEILDHSKGTFMRKGIVGDWKNFLTVAAAERFDAVYEEQMKGVDCDLYFQKGQKRSAKNPK